MHSHMFQQWFSGWKTQLESEHDGAPMRTIKAFGFDLEGYALSVWGDGEGRAMGEYPEFPIGEITEQCFPVHVELIQEEFETLCPALSFGSPVPPESFETGEFPDNYARAPAKDGRYLEVPYTSYGDYDGGMVERSNSEAFKELFDGCPWWTEEIGLHGSRRIMVDLWSLAATDEDDEPERLLDLLSGLYDYPLIDEERMSNLEQEEFFSEENFSHMHFDVIRSAKEQADSLFQSAILDNLPICTLYPMFLEFSEEREISPEFEGTSPRYPVEDFAEWLLETLFDGVGSCVQGQILFDENPNKEACSWHALSQEQRIAYDKWAENLGEAIC